MVREFIQNYAKSGPEKTGRDGQYTEFLIEPAKVVSQDDAVICPKEKPWNAWWYIKREIYFARKQNHLVLLRGHFWKIVFNVLDHQSIMFWLL
jgi:hypothetical protein